MLYIIGIGLNDEKDISIKGLEAVKGSDFVYLETYTSRLNCKIEDLEKLYKKKIILADRNLIEKDADKILEQAKTKDVALLIIGDVFSATTHADLYLRAREKKIEINIIHNASVVSAIGITGLSVYNFGKITTIPLENKDITSPIEVFKKNQKNNLHTLFLLDIKPNKLMTAAEGADYLIKNKISKETMAVACAALGSEKQYLKYDTLENISKAKVNKFPQCMIIPGKMHFMEEDMLNLYR